MVGGDRTAVLGEWNVLIFSQVRAGVKRTFGWQWLLGGVSFCGDDIACWGSLG